MIVLSARQPHLFWLYALLATAGSLVGAMVTFWIGRKVGEHGLTRLMKPSRLERVQYRVSHHAGIRRGGARHHSAAVPLHRVRAGQRRVRRTALDVLHDAGRGPRWSGSSPKAGSPRIYGRRILAWMQSTTFEVVIGALIVLAITGTIVSGVAVLRSTGSRSPPQ